MILPSYSREPFVSADYSDGEIYRLDEGSVLGQAILCERWLNMTSAEQSYWVNLARSAAVRFVGTVLSSSRQQVELTLIYPESSPQAETYIHFCVSLPNFRRFLSDPR